MSEQRKPDLTYTLSAREDRRYVEGDVPIHTVFEVQAWEMHGRLMVVVTGRMLKKDGEASRRRRSTRVNLDTAQPDWLWQIIDDARRRLS